MANPLNENISGKFVVMKPEQVVGTDPERVFFVTGAFGAYSFTSGTCLAGEFVFDGDTDGIDSYHVLRHATDDEIDESKKLRASRGLPPIDETKFDP